MSSHSGITEAQVFEVAERLLVSGQVPTYKSIRDDLKTGSFSTLAHHLAQWKKLQSEQSLIPQPPSELHSRTLQIWNSAYREAEKIFSHEKQAFEKAYQSWKEEKAEFFSVIQKLEHERELNIIQQNETQAQLRQVSDFLIQTQTQLETVELRRVETLLRADRLEAQFTQWALGIAQAKEGNEITMS